MNAANRSNQQSNRANEADADLFEDVVVTLPALGIVNRKDSIDQTFLLVHVHNVPRCHDARDAVKNRPTNH